MQFKSAVIFRRAMTDGGLYATMMPGVFETETALRDGMKTHAALAPGEFVYLAVDITIDDKRNPVSVLPITLNQIAE